VRRGRGEYDTQRPEKLTSFLVQFSKFQCWGPALKLKELVTEWRAWMADSGLRSATTASNHPQLS
jgi:hypothetical protein